MYIYITILCFIILTLNFRKLVNGAELKLVKGLLMANLTSFSLLTTLSIFFSLEMLLWIYLSIAN